MEKNERTQMKQLTLEINERQEEEELQVRIEFYLSFECDIHAFISAARINCIGSKGFYLCSHSGGNPTAPTGKCRWAARPTQGCKRLQATKGTIYNKSLVSIDLIPNMHFREHQMPTSFLGVGNELHRSES